MQNLSTFFYKLKQNAYTVDNCLDFFEKFIFIIFWLHCEACWILVPQPGIKPIPLAVKVQHLKSLKHWTTKEVPRLNF